MEKVSGQLLFRLVHELTRNVRQRVAWLARSLHNLTTN
jgi:hypothetical protein